MIRFCLQIIFFPAYFSKLRFHRNSIGIGYLNHFFCQCHIFFKCFMGSIDHHITSQKKWVYYSDER